jgi:hypothetical protein
MVDTVDSWDGVNGMGDFTLKEWVLEAAIMDWNCNYTAEDCWKW